MTELQDRIIEKVKQFVALFEIDQEVRGVFVVVNVKSGSPIYVNTMRTSEDEVSLVRAAAAALELSFPDLVNIQVKDKKEEELYDA